MKMVGFIKNVKSWASLAVLLFLTSSTGVFEEHRITLDQLKTQPIYELTEALEHNDKSSITRLRTNFVEFFELLSLFKNLKGLELYDLQQSVPKELQEFPNIQLLDLSVNNELTDIISVSYLHQLEDLSLSSTELELLPSEFARLQKLQNFRMHLGKNLKDIQVLGQLPKLTYLELVDCNAVEKFPAKLPSLRHLKTSDIFTLVNIQQVLQKGGNIDSLTYLELNACGDVQTAISFIPSFKGLKSLNLSNNPQLKNLELLQNMTSLEFINLSFCNTLETIPSSFSSLQNLKTINLSFNSALKDISGLASLQNIQTLILPRADLINTLPAKDQDRFKKFTLVIRNNLKKDGIVYY